MKVCPKCGVSQKDDRSTCVECGAVLGKPLDEESAYQVEKNRREAISDMVESREYDYIGPLQKILIGVNLAVIAAGIVRIVLAGIGVLSIHGPAILYAFLFSAYVVFDTAFPRAVWFLDSYRLRYYVSDVGSPTTFYVTFKRFTSVLLTLISVITMVIEYLS